jgi:hypothetical protein
LGSFWCWSSGECAPQAAESPFALAGNQVWLETGANQVDLAGAAEQLVSGVKETHYQHKTHVDTSQGVYDLDCSGLVDYLLKRVAPDRFAQIPIEPGHSRPRQVIYY